MKLFIRFFRSQRPRYELLAFSLISLFCGAKAGELTFVAGTETEMVQDGLADPVIIWVPSDYETKPARQWPVVYWYPGTGGHPSVEFIRRHTGGSGWIIVGMGFSDPGRFQADEAGISGELAILDRVRERLGARLRLDPGRAFAGGFSKGGWVSGIFLARDSSLAGALILGAGLLETPPASATPRREAFVGIGELDGNRAMSEQAARGLRSANRCVTMDVWNGLGHTLPGSSESLRQWLRCAGSDDTRTALGIDPLVAESVEWFDDAFARLTKGTEPLRERYFVLKQLKSMPFFSYLDEEGRSDTDETLQAWTALPVMAAEIAAEQRYLEILDRESRDRQIGTLTLCRDHYHQLATDAPATFFGAAAARAAERASAMLK